MRSSTFAYAKKAISYYMPHCAASLDPIDMSGKPTKPQASSCQRFDHGGKKEWSKWEGCNHSCTALVEWKDFASLLVLCHIMFVTSPLMYVRLGIFSIQWQLIRQIDDVMMIKKITVSFNLQYPFTSWLKCVISVRCCVRHKLKNIK